MHYEVVMISDASQTSRESPVPTIGARFERHGKLSEVTSHRRLDYRQVLARGRQD
jgi:hypothetical protein